MYKPSRRAFLAKGAVATAGVLVGGSLAGSDVGIVAGSTTSTFPHVTTGDQGWLGQIHPRNREGQPAFL